MSNYGALFIIYLKKSKYFNTTNCEVETCLPEIY